MGVSGLGCVAFSVYVLGLVSSPLGVGLGCVTFSVYVGWPKIVVRWLHSRLAVGTFFFQGWPLEPSSSKVAPRNFWERKIWRSIGATQRFDRNAGGPKLWQVGWIRGLPSGLAFANLKILRTEFLARHRRHAAFRLRRGGARAKSSRYIAPGFVAFAGRGAQKP